MRKKKRRIKTPDPDHHQLRNYEAGHTYGGLKRCDRKKDAKEKKRCERKKKMRKKKRCEGKEKKDTKEKKMA